MQSYDMVVIGAGAAGLTAAAGSAKFGLKVALIEKEKLGGDCLYHGCVPSKTLIRSAKVVSLIKRAHEFGLHRTEPAFDFENVIGHVSDVIREIGKHDDPERFRKMGIEVIFGAPRFISPREIELDGKKIRSKKFIISTGSSPLIPNIRGLPESGYITHTDLFHLRQLPPSMIVIGAGPIGMEMAQAFARFGSDITVIEIENQILPKEDIDISKTLESCLGREGIRFYKGTTVKRVSKENGKRVVVCVKDGKEFVHRADEILVAAGRIPNTNGLNLEASGVKHNEKGITVNGSLKTNAKNIWACGDVVGPYLFTHMAEYQAGIVLRNALFRLPTKVDYSAVPWTTFTDPEVAHIGLTESQAKEQDLDYTVYKYNYSDVDRAVTEGEGHGFVKVLTTGWKGTIIGAHIIGPNAGELIHELILAVRKGLTVKDISTTIHVYPTLALGTRQTTDLYFHSKFFSSGWTRRLLRLAARILK